MVSCFQARSIPLSYSEQVGFYSDASNRTIVKSYSYTVMCGMKAIYGDSLDISFNFNTITYSPNIIFILNIAPCIHKYWGINLLFFILNWLHLYLMYWLIVICIWCIWCIVFDVLYRRIERNYLKELKERSNMIDTNLWVKSNLILKELIVEYL